MIAAPITLLYQSPYQTLWLHQTTYKILRQVWHQKSAYMPDETYQQEMQKVCEAIYQQSLQGWLIDAQAFDYQIVPPMQEWTHTHIFARLADSALQRIAYLAPADLVIELGMEQTLDENPHPHLLHQRFLHCEEALAWLTYQE